MFATTSLSGPKLRTLGEPLNEIEKATGTQGGFFLHPKLFHEIDPMEEVKVPVQLFPILFDQLSEVEASPAWVRSVHLTCMVAHMSMRLPTASISSSA